MKNRSYWTSLCLAWLDHEVLNTPDEKERLVELVSELDGGCLERICEWIIDTLQAEKHADTTHSRLMEHQEDIDYIAIAGALCEEWSLTVC